MMTSAICFTMALSWGMSWKSTARVRVPSWNGAAALELEHCHNLKLALDISQNLKCYDWTSCADLAASAEMRLQTIGISEELIRTTGIDLAGYEAHLLEEDGYMFTADESAYIRRNNWELSRLSPPTAVPCRTWT